MKTSDILRFVFAAGLAVAALVPAVFAAKEKKAKDPAEILLRVEVPSLMGDSWREDEVIDIFVSRVYDAFRREGYKGRLDWERGAEPKGEQRLIAINLIRWRGSRTGGVECTFTASVEREGVKSVPLGVFNGLTLRMGGGALSAAGAYEDSAEDALRDLYRKMAKENLLPTGKPETKS